MVAKAFIENPDPINYTQVNHIDGNKMNNCVDNLEWCDSLMNIRHAYSTGLNRGYGEDHPLNKYSEKTVRKICKLLEKGERIVDISERLDVPETVISGIKNKHIWKRVSDEYTFPEDNKNWYTEEQIREVCKMIEDNYTNKEISEKLGVHRQTVINVRLGNKWKNISKDYNFPDHDPGKLAPDIVRQICRLMQDGKQNKQIADITGVSKDKIKAIRARRTYTDISREYNF